MASPTVPHGGCHQRRTCVHGVTRSINRACPVALKGGGMVPAFRGDSRIVIGDVVQGDALVARLPELAMGRNHSEIAGGCTSFSSDFHCPSPFFTAVASARADAGVSHRAGQPDAADPVGGGYGRGGAFAWAGIHRRGGAGRGVLQLRVLGLRLPAHGYHGAGVAGAWCGRCTCTAGERGACVAAGAGYWCAVAGAAGAGHPHHADAAGGK